MSQPFTLPASDAFPELFFALVGPSGADMDSVVHALEAELCAVGYQLDRGKKLSELLHSLEPFEELQEFSGTEDERIRKYMDAGDQARAQFQHGGVLAALAVNSVRERRGETSRARTAYLFRSLKHPGEVEVLRLVYASSLIVISVYDNDDARFRRLAQRIQRSGRGVEEASQKARELMKRDQEGVDAKNKFGQSVRKTFPLADFFLDMGKELRGQVERLIHLLFEHPFKSPTRDEYAMFTARATALRSVDLSRQVGAVVCNDGEVVVAGCNEVPKPGGGVYWEGDMPDLRDFQRGADPNALMGSEVLVEVLSELRRAGWLNQENAKYDGRELVRMARELGIFKQARISNLIEFGRVVHAEMNALSCAARRGIPLEGLTLYCTTFPCHLCARHLLSAGLSEVVYIEPYPKSLAVDLYDEAIVLGGSRQPNRLVFRPFTGVSPTRFLDFFDYGKRKDTFGFAEKWEPKNACPRTRQAGNPHLLVEEALCVKLHQALEVRNLV